MADLGLSVIKSIIVIPSRFKLDKDKSRTIAYMEIRNSVQADKGNSSNCYVMPTILWKGFYTDFHFSMPDY